MIADINIKDYYLQFIHDAQIDAKEYKEKLDKVLEVKESVHKYLSENKERLINTYQIDITTFDLEWVEKKYNPAEHLYNRLIKLFNITEENKDREVLTQAIKYCNILRNEDKFTKLINLCSKRKKLSLKEYKSYVAKYFIKVHECVLNGMGYRFAYGTGTFVINYWKMNPDLSEYSKKLDYAATNKKKKELLALGKKLYDEKEAQWYKARNIPYDGVDYRVYKRDHSFYEITFIKSVILKNNFEYQRTEYSHKDYRGLTQQELAEKYCKTVEDVYPMRMDIRYKLNVMLHIDPTKYLNFIRNAEQVKYKHRAHNSED